MSHLETWKSVPRLHFHTGAQTGLPRCSSTFLAQATSIHSLNCQKTLLIASTLAPHKPCLYTVARDLEINQSCLLLDLSPTALSSQDHDRIHAACQACSSGPGPCHPRQLQNGPLSAIRPLLGPAKAPARWFCRGFTPPQPSVWGA